MTATWICAWPGGQTAWDSEREAEREAGEMVKSGRAKFAVTYQVDVEGEG